MFQNAYSLFATSLRFFCLLAAWLVGWFGDSLLLLVYFLLLFKNFDFTLGYLSSYICMFLNFLYSVNFPL